MLFSRQRLASAILAALGSGALFFGSPGCANKTPAYVPFPNLQQVGLRQVWERQIVVAHKEKIDHLWRVGDSVYVTTTQGRVARIDAASGVKTWDISVGSGASEFHRPLETGGGKHVVLTNRGEAVVINKATGRIEAMSSLGFLATTSPVVIGTNLCIGGNDYFYGLYLDQLGGRVWVTVSQQDGFSSDPAVISESLVIASTKGKLWRVNGADGNWIWKDRKVNGDVTGGLASDGKVVYVPCLDHYLYAFDAATGSELWDSRLDGVLDQKPLLTKGTVLVPSSGKGLYAVSTSNGETKWEADGITQIAAVMGDHLWAGDSSGNLKELSMGDGSVISTTPIPEAQEFVHSPDDWIIILNKSGVLEGYRAEK